MYGVSQGSILGHRLFSIYTLLIDRIIRKYYPNARFMFLPNDQQLYLIFDPCDPPQDVSSMEPLIADVQAWLIKNIFMINDTKRDALITSFRKLPTH